MENRTELGTAQPEDVWAQLHQKEADLQLAAELGKALLEKNEELKRQQDAIIEEYNRKLEVRTASCLYGGAVFIVIFIRVAQEVICTRGVAVLICCQRVRYRKLPVKPPRGEIFVVQMLDS